MTVTGPHAGSHATVETGIRTPTVLLTAALALVLPIAFSSALSAPSWTPKAAILLFALPLGLLALAPLVRSPVRYVAGAALVWVAIAAVSTATSSNPSLAFFGAYGAGTGLLFVAALPAMWALGVRAGASGGGRLVGSAVLAAAVVNAAFSIAQATFELDRFGLGLFEQRSAGLMGNPVHLASLLSAAIWLTAARFVHSPLRVVPAVLMLAMGVELAGSRLGVALAIVAGVVHLARHRTARSSLFGAVVLCGLLLGNLAGNLHAAVSGAERIAEIGDQSTSARVQGWRSAASAVAERPLVGHGPGRYLTATTPHRGLALAKIGPDSYFRDAHNIVVEYAVTTGLLGLLALASFVCLAAWRARGELAAFAAALLAFGLLQPQFVGTTPLAFLAFGAASTIPVPRDSRRLRVTVAPAAALGIGLALMLLVGDFLVVDGMLANSRTRVERGDSYLPPWPEPLTVAARLEVFAWATTRQTQHIQSAIALHREAVRRDPSDPRWWNDLAAVQLAADRPSVARASYARALALAPYSAGAMLGLARVEASDGGNPSAGIVLIDTVEQVSGRTEATRRLRSALEAKLADR